MIFLCLIVIIMLYKWKCQLWDDCLLMRVVCFGISWLLWFICKQNIWFFIVAMLLFYIGMIDAFTMYIDIQLLVMLLGVSIFIFMDYQKSLVVACLCISLPMYLCNCLFGDCFGMGDVELMFVVGFLLGYPEIIYAFLLANLFGGGYVLYLMFTGKKSFKMMIPYAPFLCLGTLIVFLK